MGLTMSIKSKTPEVRRAYYKKHKEAERATQKIRLQKWPWYKTYFSILHRCHDKNKIYYLGIKNYLTIRDLKYLWFRDKAYLMDRPTIDRINPKSDYTLENCRYLEMTENIRRAERNILRNPITGRFIKSL